MMVYLPPAEWATEILEHATGSYRQGYRATVTREFASLATREHDGVIAHIFDDIVELHPHLRGAAEDAPVQRADVVEPAHDPAQRIVQRDQRTWRPYGLQCVQRALVEGEVETFERGTRALKGWLTRLDSTVGCAAAVGSRQHLRCWHGCFLSLTRCLLGLTPY